VKQANVEIIVKRLLQFFESCAVVVLFLSCAITYASGAQAKPAWQVEWEKTIEAAKKEGQVAVYISGYE